MKRLFASLRFRLFLLVLLALLPALGLTLYGDLERRQAAALAAQQEALRIVRFLATDQEHLIESTRQLLVTLAQLPDLRRGDAVTCSALLANLRQQYPLYANLGLADRNGDLVCSAVPATGPVNYTDRVWFQNVLRTRDFAVGGYVMGKVTRKPLASFAYPVLDEVGMVQGVVFAGLDLAWLNRFIAEADLPSGSVLTVIDGNGTILARSLEPDKWVGEIASESPAVKAILARQGQGMIEATGLDGIRRLYASAPLVNTGQAGDVFVYLGIPTAVAYAQADRVLTRNLVALGLMAVLGLVVAWGLGNVLVLRSTLEEKAHNERMLLALDQAAQRELAERKQAEQALRESEERCRQNAIRAEALARAASRLNAHLDLNAVLDAICEETVHALNVPAASVTLYDEQGQMFYHAATLGLSAEYLERAKPFPRALYDNFAEAMGPVIVIQDVQELSGLPNADLFSASGVRTIVGATMSHEGQLIGGLNIFTFGAVRQFSDDELTLLKGLADQAALAIAHARLYTSLQEANLQLYDALQAKDAMIQNVSHELRTPLTTISGYIELMSEGDLGPFTAEQEGALQVMRQQSARLYYMVNRLLILQTLGTMTLEKVELDVGLLLRQTLEAWQLRAAAAGARLQLEVSSDLPGLVADPDLLEQVFENLVENAVKFSPNGGVIRLAAWAESRIPEVREALRRGPGGPSGILEVLIAVSDEGIGIPPDKLGRIFDRFYQVDSSTRRHFGGAGIGLALCRAIVEAHSGRIWAASAGEGKGSTFYVALPV